MHAFQHEEIESSNAFKAEEADKRAAEAGRWHNVLASKVTSGDTAELVSGGLKSLSRGFGTYRILCTCILLRPVYLRFCRALTICLG